MTFGLLPAPRRIKYATEAAQIERLRQPRLLHDQELAAIRGDWEAGFAREMADDELERRAGLSAHERLREAIGRAG
jgi:hypothetical protein